MAASSYPRTVVGSKVSPQHKQQIREARECVMGAEISTYVESRQLRRRLQRKYLAKRLIRIRRRAQAESYVVKSLEPVGQPP